MAFKYNPFTGKLDLVNPAGAGGGGANLTFSRTATTVTVISDSGTDAVLPAATTALAGVSSAADKTKLDNIEALADVTDTANVGAATDGAAAKATPVDADTFPLNDSAAAGALKKVTFLNAWGNYFKSLADALYTMPLVSTILAGSGTGGAVDTGIPYSGGKIAGASPVGGGTGGTLNMNGATGPATGNGGSINLSGDVQGGGSINLSGSATGGGGTIDLSGGATSGGNLTLSGGTVAGGSVIANDGGGSINTRGVGLIELGEAATRTSLVGAATTPRSIALPDADGVVSLLALDTGWVYNGAVGDKTAVVGSYSAVDFSALDVSNIGLNALSTQVELLTKKLQALEYALSQNLRPDV